MANSTDNPEETTSASTQVTIDGDTGFQVPPEDSEGQSLTETAESDVTEAAEDKPDQRKYEHTEEVPALLGKVAICSNEEPEVVPIQDAVEKIVEDSAILADSAGVAEEPQAVRIELQNILENVQDSLANTKYISSKIDVVSSDTDCLIKQVNILSGKYELLAAEMESSSSSSRNKNVLSKTFLTISASLVAMLMAFQIYMFVSMIKTQQRQDVASSLVMGNISTLNKKMTYHNSNTAKALTNPAQQEHAQPTTLSLTENSGHEGHQNKEVASANNTSVLERLNKLRNGLPEKKLIRKESGDWFAYNKKSEECISDVEVVEALNQAYKKIGRTLTPPVPLPAHNSLCILRPDGKGGTEIVMTKAFLP